MAITPQQQANNEVTDNAVAKAMKSPRWTSSNEAQRQKLIDDRMISLQKQQQGIKANLDQILTNKTLEEGKYITTPISQYGAKENEISKYNPDLLALSKKYDDLVAQHDSLWNDIVNLNDVKSMMQSSVDKQISAVNKSADETNKGNTLSKAIQVWAAQWTAGMQWATAGQLNKAQNEIENNYAPKFADTEAQRQAWLGAAAQLEAGIPTAMSSVANQNSTNRYNNALAAAQRRAGQKSSVLNPFWGSKTPATNTQGPAVIDPATGKVKTGSINLWGFVPFTY